MAVTVDNTNIVGTKTGPQLVSEIYDQFGNCITDLTERTVKTAAETISGGWTFSVAQTFSGSINVTGSVKITTGGVLIGETTDHTETPTAGKGEFWVRDDVPCVPMFTDDDNNDFQLGLGDVNAKIRTITVATDNILASDNGKVLICDRATAIALTLPDTFATNFQFTIIQVDAGVPTVTRSGTDTINGAATGVTPSGQWAGVYFVQFASGEWSALT